MFPISRDSCCCVIGGTFCGVGGSIESCNELVGPGGVGKVFDSTSSFRCAEVRGNSEGAGYGDGDAEGILASDELRSLLVLSGLPHWSPSSFARLGPTMTSGKSSSFRRPGGE